MEVPENVVPQSGFVMGTPRTQDPSSQPLIRLILLAACRKQALGHLAGNDRQFTGYHAKLPDLNQILKCLKTGNY